MNMKTTTIGGDGYDFFDDLYDDEAPGQDEEEQETLSERVARVARERDLNAVKAVLDEVDSARAKIILTLNKYRHFPDQRKVFQTDEWYVKASAKLNYLRLERGSLIGVLRDIRRENERKIEARNALLEALSRVTMDSLTIDTLEQIRAVSKTHLLAARSIAHKRFSEEMNRLRACSDAGIKELVRTRFWEANWVRVGEPGAAEIVAALNDLKNAVEIRGNLPLKARQAVIAHKRLEAQHHERTVRLREQDIEMRRLKLQERVALAEARVREESDRGLRFINLLRERGHIAERDWKSLWQEVNDGATTRSLEECRQQLRDRQTERAGFEGVPDGVAP